MANDWLASRTAQGATFTTILADRVAKSETKVRSCGTPWPKLHVVLLWAMGWDGGHLHEFVFGDTNYGMPDPNFPSDPPMLNEARVSLGRALGALKLFTYI